MKNSFSICCPDGYFSDKTQVLFPDKTGTQLHFP